MYKDLFLQILVIILPLLLHFSVIKERNLHSKHLKLLIFLYCSGVLVFCLSCPFKLGSGGFFDLRLIPWISAFLYGGPWVGLSITIILFLYRFILGGAGMYVVFLSHSVIGYVLILLSQKYFRLPYKDKLKYSLSILFLHIFLDTFLSYLIIPNITFSLSSLTFFLFLTIIYLITLWMVVTLIDFMDNNLKLQQELVRAEKMNIVGQLAASVAHEVRNPMTTVKGFLQLMSMDNHISTKNKEYIHISLEELDRANHIIHDYLSLAKPLEQIDLVDIQNEIIQMKKTLSSYAIFHNVALNIKNNPPLYVYCNQDKLKQVLLNIIKNGIEAIQCPNGNVEIRTYSSPHFIFIEIEDNGIGMTTEEMDRLGLPFYTTKEKGTGLGMMVCYKIIESMKGAISIKSKKGSGTCFTIKLPNAEFRSPSL